MTFKVDIIAHSVHKGKEIVTFQVAYPRYIHGEVMTHRVFSRNAMSSRAIPVAKMLKQVWSTPAAPIHWGKNQPGMQAHEELQGLRRGLAKSLWNMAGKAACLFSYLMSKLGTAKQVANRPLEPYQWMVTIITATEWDNFYELRDHPDAQPEFQHLAKMMRKAHADSQPVTLEVGEWHLPYVTLKEQLSVGYETACKLSVARCARVSYLTHDGKVPEIAADLKLFDRLVGMRPLHASPAEHQATPGNVDTGNFVGWTQYRKLWEKTL